VLWLALWKGGEGRGVALLRRKHHWVVVVVAQTRKCRSRARKKGVMWGKRD